MPSFPDFAVLNDRLEQQCVALWGEILCEHMRVIQRSNQLPPCKIYDWRHYLRGFFPNLKRGVSPAIQFLGRML
jgi:hypothetical protein